MAEPPTRPVPEFRRRLASPDRILAAALDVFCEAGFARARLEDIGRRIGASKSAIYLHFPSKQHVFEALVEQLCLAPDRPDDLRQPDERLRGELGQGPAEKVLKLVLSEWSQMPGLAARYIDALATRVRMWPGAGEEARRLVDAVVAERAFTLVFAPGR